MERFSFYLLHVVLSTSFIAVTFSQEMNAKMNSYNMQVTANKDGTMLKFLSPETDVQNTYLRTPPKVQVNDIPGKVALLTPQLADVTSSNPKMSIKGELDAYKYQNAKTNPKLYKLVKVLHTNHDVEPIRAFTKEVNGRGERNELVKQTVLDDESSGLIDEESSGEEEKNAEDKAEHFPPKAPEIPIELGNTAGKQLQKSKNQLKEKMSPITNNGKQKPCVEASCVEDGDDGGDEEGQEENEPQPDIPIELGLVDSNAAGDDQYRVVDIEQKTPETFIMLLPDTSREKEMKRQRRSVLNEEVISERDQILRRHHTKGSHHKRSKGHRHRRYNGRNHIKKKRFWNTVKAMKRNEIDIPDRKNRLVGFNNPKSKPIVQKPVQAYIVKLSKDLQNIMGQAKRVLQNTDQVTDGLKRIVGGTSILSNIANDAVENVKFFRTSSHNSNVEYLHEQAIVALIAAAKASREAEESAIIARVASEKASETARRMSISRTPQHGSIVSSDNQADVTKSQALKATKAASFATTQMGKVKSISSFLNKTLKRMEIAMNPQKQKQSLHPAVLVRKDFPTIGGKQMQRDESPDPEYEDFNESSRKSSLPKNSKAIQRRKTELGPSPDEVNPYKRKAIRKQPQQPIHHLVPGEYTGFKRSGIPESDIPSFSRLKSVGQTGLEDSDIDMLQNKSNIDQNNTMNFRSSNASVKTSKTGTFVPETSSSGSYSSGESGDGEETDKTNDDGVDFTKLLAKAPISVDIHVSSVKSHDTDGADSDGDDVKEASVDVDPFGFTKKDHGVVDEKEQNHEMNLDPFGFKHFQEEQESGVDRKSNNRLNRREKTPTIVGLHYHPNGRRRVEEKISHLMNWD